MAMMNTLSLLSILLLLHARTTASAVQDPVPVRNHFVSATLGSNMVLQRDQPAVLWGWSTTPGALVTTTLRRGIAPPMALLNTTASTSTGLWRQALPVQPASKLPYTIETETKLFFVTIALT